ncbi:putative xyloglucan glycosyltransferase 5 [Dorcoceras hygrometricum]|uniref:Putative xyloglucan glycosyltransferase 5 n=1 Tax=Dorcoceras hygrometricum TaxID=472368 RepID=A0A2Z7D198_9LAMI|nr:putative xyloglucan glycosyltransferase 5 [Dorcoceras hygrometricum]
MKRRRVGDSADGLVLMTSSVTSSYSADGLKEQSQESAGSLHPDARGSDVVEETSSRKLQCNQQRLFEDQFQTQCFEHPVARRFRQSFWTTRRKQQQHPVERLFESAVAIYSIASYSVQSQDFQAQRIEVAKCSSRCVISAAKQLTNYQSWMSTAELNSNGESDKKPAKEKDASTVPLSELYRGALH